VTRRIPDSYKANKINWLKSDCMPWELSFYTIERTISALLILWFRAVQQQIACLQAEISETIDHGPHGDPTPPLVDGSNLSLKCLGELNAQLSWQQMENNFRLDTTEGDITQGFEDTSLKRSEGTFMSDLHADPDAAPPEREVTNCAS
jgi:hypothetical protein